MPTVQSPIEHPQTTRTRHLRYQFTPKHQGGPCSHGQAQWLATLAFEEEFSVFDGADASAVCDAHGNMFGVLRDGEGDLRDLGIWGEQVAEFPRPTSGPWHGYPCWTLNRGGPSNRRGEQMRPPKQVLDQLFQAGMITAEQRDRLKKGDHA